MIMKHTLKIEGMHCAKCVERVNKALSELNGAENVEVDLENACASLETNAEIKEIKEAVEDLGFEVVEIN